MAQERPATFPAPHTRRKPFSVILMHLVGRAAVEDRRVFRTDTSHQHQDDEGTDPFTPGRYVTKKWPEPQQP